MNIYHLVSKYALTLWPVVVAIQAYFYRKKQNGNNPLTGGPISWPKAFWLSYTVWTWFLLPFFIIFHPLLSESIQMILIAHLVSWWTRGILELVMIYKWFNWTPIYGISHDVFHIVLIAILLWIYRFETFSSVFGSMNFLASIYLLMLFISTSAEILFARMFLKYRSEIEAKVNIYFASDDEKWKKINRITLIVVIIVYIHLMIQSSYSFVFF